MNILHYWHFNGQKNLKVIQYLQLSNPQQHCQQLHVSHLADEALSVSYCLYSWGHHHQHWSCSSCQCRAVCWKTSSKSSECSQNREIRPPEWKKKGKKIFTQFHNSCFHPELYNFSPKSCTDDSRLGLLLHLFQQFLIGFKVCTMCWSVHVWKWCVLLPERLFHKLSQMNPCIVIL